MTAGILKTIILPESKLSLTYGCIPYFFGYINDINGHGLMPDVPITYTIDDILANKDLEMEWVLKDIAKRAHPNKLKNLQSFKTS